MMGPNACLQRMLDAWHALDYGEMGRTADDLGVWITNGGAAPTPTAEQLESLLSIASHYAWDTDAV